MDHLSNEQEPQLHRLGFHYFLDAERYHANDAKLWFGKLNQLSANWLVLKNPAGRAIPEDFIRQAAKQDIRVIIDFNKTMNDFEGLSEIETLLRVYGKWGVKYACLFSEPNLRKNWGDTQWVNVDIVAKHADLFLEFSKTCVENKIQPIFSHLHPGGDYPDLAFLEQSLRLIQTKADPIILKKLIISAYGWHHHHPLDWGAGGKKMWPNANLFDRQSAEQDHHGFRLFEWYSEISEKMLGKKLPIILFEAGFAGRGMEVKQGDNDDWAPNLDAVLGLLSGRNVFDHINPDHLLAPISQEVIACCTYILSAQADQDLFPYRWFTANGEPLAPARSYLPSRDTVHTHHHVLSANLDGNESHQYQRYIFIDRSLQSEMPTILEKLDPYIKKHRPIIGFSLLEGSKSAYLIVITQDRQQFLENNANLIPQGILTKIIEYQKINELLGE